MKYFIICNKLNGAKIMIIIQNALINLKVLNMIYVDFWSTFPDGHR